MKTVLIHASVDDVHADAVARCLRELGVNSFVATREQCFKDWNISCRDDEVILSAESEKTQWRTADFRSVFWRRDFIVEPTWVPAEGLEPSVVQFLAEQRSIHVDCAFKRLSSTCPFINNLDSNRRASSKALQHHVARRCQLSVPETYIGNDPHEAEKFASGIWNKGNRCCTKNIESSHVAINGVKHARLTHFFSEGDLPDLSGLAICPMIFQEYIEKRFEYRVTVVGNEVFSCRIDSQSAGGATAVDWRNYAIPSTPHHAVQLDQSLEEKLVRLVGELGLTYGAIDLIESPEGEFYFLEVNSMGQWLWIEDLTELPISMSIARHLANPEKICQP